MLRHGDIETDEDGREWYISLVTFQNGRPKYSRILVGSLAHAITVERTQESQK